MSLLTVRQQFAELSGRHDLVTDFAGGTYTNNAANIGADFFLDAGQRMLDRKFSGIKSYAWYKKDVTVGTYKIKFQSTATVKEVWCMNATTDRYQLEKKDYNWIRVNYGEVYSNLSQGAPEYYSPLVMNLAPEQAALTTVTRTTEFTYDHEEILFTDTADHFNYQGILFMSPADTTYTMSILARFRSVTLTGSVKTFWTEVHPDILVLAGLWTLEKFYRNREGMNDYMQAILDAVIDLEKDSVEEEVQDLDQMWG